MFRVNSCPTKVYKYNEETKQVDIEDALRCTYCQECVRKAEDLGKPDLVTIAPKPDRFIFTVEVCISLTRGTNVSADNRSSKA